MQWTDARVVIVDVLCTAEQQEQLVSQVTAALRAFEERVVAKQGRWGHYWHPTPGAPGRR